MGPWNKSDESPIIQRGFVGEGGPGHGDAIMVENGEIHYVLHTHFSNASVHPRKTAIIQLTFTEDEDGNEILKAENETFTYLKSKEEL